ncbi:hypothetical protein BC830DRAFT_1084614 [Chytriomyces sp. MP71]|nr:hypothetical protein BC830DRAFT_1084614 [Chytriomyces sp. MP71]
MGGTAVSLLRQKDRWRMPSPRTVSYPPGFTLPTLSKQPSKPEMQESDASETPSRPFSYHHPTPHQDTSSPPSTRDSGSSPGHLNRKRIDRKRHHFLKYCVSEAGKTTTSVSLLFPSPPTYVALPVPFPQSARASAGEEAELVRVKEQFNVMQAKLNEVVQHQRDMATAMGSLVLEMRQFRDQCRDCRTCRKSLGVSASSTNEENGEMQTPNGIFEEDADGFFLISDESDGYDY